MDKESTVRKSKTSPGTCLQVPAGEPLLPLLYGFVGTLHLRASSGGVRSHGVP